MNRQATIVLVLLSLTGMALPSNAQDSQSTYEGFTHPRYDIMVAATEIGRVEEVMVKAGDQVTKGDVIARLEDSMQNASVRVAELQSRMHGELDAAKAERDMQQMRAAQVKSLAKDGMARPDELARAESDFQVAAARYQTALEQTQLRALELERYKLQLDRRRVRSPMTGTIAKVFHEPGEYITPGDPAVVQLLVTDQLYAVFNVPVEDTTQLKVGDDAGIYLRSQSKTIATKIHSLASSIDGESGTLEVRVILANPDGKLRAGDRCTMQLGNSHRRAARLPELPSPPAARRLPPTAPSRFRR